jgi:hypothetical protein
MMLPLKLTRVNPGAVALRLLKVFFNSNLKPLKMGNQISITTKDVVEADITVKSLTVDADGVVTVEFQKTLKDTTDSTFANDGDAITKTLTAEEAAPLLQAISDAITPVITTQPAPVADPAQA